MVPRTQHLEWNKVSLDVSMKGDTVAAILLHRTEDVPCHD